MVQADINWLFMTNALEVSPGHSPFWYTSGEIGPYYINTHYLCGGKQTATDLLSFIDAEAEYRAQFPRKMLDHLKKVYRDSKIYKEVIDSLAGLVKRTLPLSNIEVISGGQRRDWFFAPMLAEKLKKRCIYLYNDGTAVDQNGQEIRKLGGSVVLNVADLLRVGSSYKEKWIPAVRRFGGELYYSLNVVDRLEGGVSNLQKAGVRRCLNLFEINQSLFDQALAQNLIAKDQFDFVSSFLEDPKGSMREFLLANPKFIEDAKTSVDERTKRRCEKLLADNLYDLA